MRPRLARPSASAFSEMSTRWMSKRAPRETRGRVSRAIFSPLPEPSSTSSSTAAKGASISAARCSMRAVSARVMGYQGSWQIASKSWEPSAS